jgi:hypothetical protein
MDDPWGARLTMGKTATAARKNRLLGAAVVKAVLRKRSGNPGATSSLYEGILRDLGVTDAQVESYLAEHQEEVDQAIRSHGRRSD